MGTLIGQIKSGFQADLLVVKGDPLEDIQDISNTECVVRKGRVLPLEELRQMSMRECGKVIDDPLTRDLLGWVYAK